MSFLGNRYRFEWEGQGKGKGKGAKMEKAGRDVCED